MHGILTHVRREGSALHRDQDGQAIFIGVFYFMLLACLVFLIINSGDVAARKIEMQNAADAAAYTGSSWYCRGLNTISMCNVAQTQFMSVIVLLDSLRPRCRRPGRSSTTCSPASTPRRTAAMCPTTTASRTGSW